MVDLQFFDIKFDVRFRSDVVTKWLASSSLNVEMLLRQYQIQLFKI